MSKIEDIPEVLEEGKKIPKPGVQGEVQIGTSREVQHGEIAVGAEGGTLADAFPDFDTDEVEKLRGGQGGKVRQGTALLDLATSPQVAEMYEILDQLPGRDFAEKKLLLNEGVAGPSWIGPLFGQAVESELERQDAAARAAGEDPGQERDVEVEVKMGRGLGFSIDLGAYANFNDKSISPQKVQLFRAMEHRIFQMQDEYGFQILEAPAGDCYVGFIPFDPSVGEEKNTRRMYGVLEAIQRKMNSIPVPNEALREDEENYPGGKFRSTVTCVWAEAGDFIARLKARRCGEGSIGVEGRAYTRLKEDEGVSSKCKVHFDKELVRRLRAIGVLVDKNNEVSGFYPEFASSMPNVDEEPLDFDLRVLSVLAKAVLRRGAMKEWIAKLNGSEGVGKEIVTQDLGTTCVGCLVGDMKHRAMYPEKYKLIDNEILDLVGEPRFGNFTCLKPNENKFYIEGFEMDFTEDGVNNLIALCIGIRKILDRHGLPRRIAAAWDKTLIRIPVKGDTPIGETAVQEVSSEAMVYVARWLKTMEKSGLERIRLDESVCMRASGTLAKREMKTEELKGVGTRQCLDISCETGEEDALDRVYVQHLFGSDKYFAKLDAEVFSQPGKFASYALLPERRGVSGYGISAIMRRVARSYENAVSVSKVGNDDVAVIRGLLMALKPETPADLSLAGVITTFGALLAGSGEVFDGKVLVLDFDKLTETEHELLERLALLLASKGNATILHTEAFKPQLGELAETVEVKGLSAFEAARLLAEMKGKSDDMHYIRSLGEAFSFVEDLDLPRTPRNVMDAYYYALRVEGGSILFEMGKLLNPEVKPGALAAKLRRHSVSPWQQRVLQFMGEVHLPMSAEVLWKTYRKEVNGKSGSSKRFEEDLQFLQEAGFLVSIKREEAGGEKKVLEFTLADSGERATVRTLTTEVFDVKGISQTLAELVDFTWDGSEISEAQLSLVEGRFYHLLKARGGGFDLQVLSLAKCLGEHYFRSERFSAARGVYRTYLDSVGHVFPENPSFEIVALYLDIAWSFYHSSVKEDLDMARDIYESVLMSGCADGQCKDAFWGLSRVIMRGAYSGDSPSTDFGEMVRANIDSEAGTKEQEDALDAAKKQEAIIELRVRMVERIVEKAGASEVDEGLWQALRHTDLYLQIFALRGLNEAKKAEQKDLLNARLLAADSFVEGDAAFISTSARLLGGSYVELGRPPHVDFAKLAMAKARFDKAAEEYEGVSKPDFIQSTDLKVGVLEALVYRIDETLKTWSPDLSDEEIDSFLQVLDDYDEAAEALRKHCLRHGDQQNLWRALFNVANAMEFRIRIAGDLLGKRDVGVNAENAAALYKKFDDVWGQCALAFKLAKGKEINPYSLNDEGFEMVRSVVCKMTGCVPDFYEK
jgi:hypothetical protein